MVFTIIIMRKNLMILTIFINILFKGNTGNDCNFDVSFCTPWSHNSSRGNFLWKRHKGATASIGTGPKQDHTKGTDQGSYVYLETSSPARPNDTAWLFNKKIDDSMDSCMSFWYHMYGPHVGSLNVYLSVSLESQLYQLCR